MIMIKKISLFMLVFYFIQVSSFAQNNTIVPFRKITDYRGIATNGNTTICYGDYGIMDYTTDFGESWKEQRVFLDNSIMAIESDGMEFYGVSDNYLFRSYNNVTYWLKQPVPNNHEIIDMSLNKNSIYILTKEGVIFSDKEMNIVNSPILNLNKNNSYSEIKTDGENLYIVKNDSLLLIYDLSSHELDTIAPMDQINCSQCDELSNLQIYNGDIYANASFDSKQGNITNYTLIKSEDKGQSWIRITKSANSYKIIEDDIYFLKSISKKEYLSTQYYKLDSSQYEIDSTYFKTINEDQEIDRYIRARNDVRINDFVVINDTIIAAGTNKLISISYDGGKSFEFKSFFDGVHTGDYYDNITFLNDSTIYVVNGYEFNKTTNGGITWLPQQYDEYNSNVYSNPVYYFIGDNGSGFAKYKQINTNNDSSALVTNDFGEHFAKTDNEELNIPIDRYIYSKGVDIGDQFLIVTDPDTNSSGDNTHLILRYDKSLSFLDSIRLTGKIINLVKTEDNKLISLNLLTSGENNPDSTGETDDYTYEYFLRESTDNGKTWNKINVNVPIRQKLKSYNDNYFYSDITHRNNLSYDNYILYPTLDSVIYEYNHMNNSFDSLNFPGSIASYRPYALFKSNSYLFIISNIKNDIYFTELGTKPASWDSLNASEVFGHWENFNSLDPEEGKDAILSAKMFNDSTGYLIIGKSFKANFFSNNFKLNFAKFYLNIPTSVNENEINNNRVYLWNSEPYPIPGKNIIKSELYWNKTYNIENAKISVYDINGNELNYVDIYIENKTPFSGILKWNCAGYNSGTYIIQIKLAGESISFPVIISK